MNNNPFEPAMTEPDDGNPPLADSAADDFTAGDDTSEDSNNLDDGGASKSPLSIDGISPSYNTDPMTGNPVIDDSLTDESSVVHVKTAKTSLDDGMLNDDHTGDFLDNLATDKDTDSPAGDDSTTPALVEPIKTESKKPEKPVKRLTISFLTIIFFILTLAGAAGTVYFYLQNGKNSDDLVKANATIQKLKDQLASYSTAENTSTGQYDSLGNKIADLSTQNKENLTTIDDYKKKVDDLTAKNADLTKQLDEQTKKASNIDNLTTKLQKLFDSCKVEGQTAGSSSPCIIET